MKKWLHFCVLALLIVCASWSATSGTLSTQQRARIHRNFQALLATVYPDASWKSGDIRRLSRAAVPGANNLYHAIVYTSNPSLVRATGATIGSVLDGFVTALLTPEQIMQLAQIDGIKYIDAGSIRRPVNDVSIPETGATLIQGGFLNGIPYRGAGTIIVLFDTGIDWKHLDFRSPTDTTKSRVLFLWDQTLTPGAGEASPVGFNYGVEYTQAQINAELGTSPPGLVRSRDLIGHGTHVAGTAAGNGSSLHGTFTGMAPDADIIIIKGGDNGFLPSNEIDGLTYAQGKGTLLSEPLIVNWSFGNQYGPHDGTDAEEVAVDNFVTAPGHVVAIAAGNDGLNPIHKSGTLSANGGSTNITLSVPTYTPNPTPGNNVFDVQVWFKGNPPITASATSPSAFTTGPVTNLDVSKNGNSTADGTFSVDNSLSYTSNGLRFVELYVRDANTNVPKTGTWTLALTNTGGIPVAYDAWITDNTTWSNGLTTTLNGGDVNETVEIPGTAEGAVTVGGYVTKWIWPTYFNAIYGYNGTDRTSNICDFSSLGPTRDGRQKPDIAAPAMGIASSLSSFSDTSGGAGGIYPGQKDIIFQGTSMAVPHIVGAASLILSAFPSTTSAEIKTLLTTGARADAFTGGVPNQTWGYGKLDAVNAMAKKFSSTAVVTRTLHAYDGTATNLLDTLTGSAKFAVRITPTVSGQLTGILLNLTTAPNIPITGTGSIICEVYSNNGGLPGTKLGSSVQFPLQRLLPAPAPNYIQMVGAGVKVSVGTDVHVVVSIANPSEILHIRTENVTTGTRSSTFNGSTWAAVTTNHRIQAIVTTASGLNSVSAVQAGVPITYGLAQNYPNPFNPSTQINYSIGIRGRVSLKIFDILGREVATLVNGQQDAGSYQITWAGRNGQNQPVTSGVYFYRLESGGFAKTNKMVLLK